jgi:hypothetical protein
VNNKIKSTIDAYPKPVRDRLTALRTLILETARATPGVGAIEEDLRWGQPSFLTAETGSGSTIRIDGFKDDAGKYAIYFHCQSGLVEQFRDLYGDKLTFVGRRAIELRVGERLPASALQHCIALALTHHLRKKPKKKRRPRRTGAL